MILPKKPETLTAVLPSAGYFRSKRATLHRFLEIRETHVLDKDGKPVRDGQAFEYIFVCTETGAERRWGLVNRYTPTWIKDGN